MNKKKNLSFCSLFDWERGHMPHDPVYSYATERDVKECKTAHSNRALVVTTFFPKQIGVFKPWKFVKVYVMFRIV